MQVSERRRHVVRRAVRDADPRPVEERVAEVDRQAFFGEPDQAADQRDVMRGRADGPDDAPFAVFEEGIEGLPVAAERIVALLLMEEEAVDRVASEGPARLFDCLNGQLAVPGVGLGRDHDRIGVAAECERAADQGIVLVILGGVDEIDPRVKGVGEHVGGLLRGKRALHRRDGERADPEAGDGGQPRGENGFREHPVRFRGIPSEARP